MDRTAGSAQAPGAVFEGWNIGAVSVKRVRLQAGGRLQADVVRHGGDPARAIHSLLQCAGPPAAGAVVTGSQAVSFLDLPYLPESICLEAALAHLGLCPDLVLSLGGETFVAYCMSAGSVRRMISSNRCAAGSGEFLVQQFGRMNLDLAGGIAAAHEGRRVALASRCSVHCKSDATHRLNKGECTPADIACSLIVNLAAKIAALVEGTGWPRDRILLAGGLAQCEQLTGEIARLIADARLESVPQSPWLEAAGAAFAACREGPHPLPDPRLWLKPADAARFPRRPSLAGFMDRVVRLAAPTPKPLAPGSDLILGVDAGSTTTKAILLEVASGRIAASRYLRTYGNPVGAALECLASLGRQLGGVPHRIVQAAVTGSGREVVSLYLDNCPVFNEILAHARAAREHVPTADTLFEIGGQDAKFVALEGGVPVDYSMNDGCSAGTGSFLEEAASSDMEVPLVQLGPLALTSAAPIAFGERCAAFINSEVRSALQQGVPRADVLAGLVYAIVENFLARVVGARQVGSGVLLQGGVALNPAVAPAVAALAGVAVTVPPNPELMGCEGAALMARDLLASGAVAALNRDLAGFGTARVDARAPFTCTACENRCEVQRFRLADRTFAFGGLCSRWEMARRPRALRRREGRDLVALRQELMFHSFAPVPPGHPRGRIGLPLALTTYELYPLYAHFLTGLGYEVVLSRRGHGLRRTAAPMCYPAELMHAAVDDLLEQGVDYIFLPYLREFDAGPGDLHAYVCPVTQDIPGVIRAFFERDAGRILTPEMGLAPHLAAVTQQQVAALGERLGVPPEEACACWGAALAHLAAFRRRYRDAVGDALARLDDPAVLLVGRPYAAYAPEVNLSVPRKIATRGFTVIPGDAFAPESPHHERNVWHYQQGLMAAVDHARAHAGRYVCNLSCFSCGPDAILHHRLRHELEGRPFCFLEVDSHTAHAGIETRIGAFLDIIEAARERRAAASVAEVPRHVAPARLEQQDGHACVVAGDGRRVPLDAPEVVHAALADGSRFVSDILDAFYSSIGWRSVVLPNTTAETLRYARRVCSGRECLPFQAMVGKAVRYLEERPKGEVTVFHLLDQDGPCQNAAWFDAAPLLFERLGVPDAVVAWPSAHNDYLGKGDKLGAMKVAAFVLGDVMNEVRSTLRCLARDPAMALAAAGDVETRLVAASRGGLLAAERELRRSAARLAHLPLRTPVEEAPRVLVFGGINRIFVDGPVRGFFEERGILAKTTGMSEFICFLQAEDIVRLGFSRGYLAPLEECSMPVLLGELLSTGDRTAALRALSARVRIGFIELLEERWRGIAAASRLLFSPHVRFGDVEREGNKRISMNGYTEAPMTIGRFATLFSSGAFDGYVNIAAFNCAPASTASAVIHTLSLRSDAPYAVVEADGDCLTAPQLRQLETAAVQCRRRREALHEVQPV